MSSLKEEVGSDNFLACRVCLDWNGKLNSIFECGLEQTFVEVLGMPLSQWDGLPQHICIICHAHLLKSQALRVRSRIADVILREAIVEQHFITNNFIHNLDRATHKLSYNLHKTSSNTTLEITHADIEPDYIKDEIETEIDDIIDLKPDSNDEFGWPSDQTNITQVGNIIVEPVVADIENEKPKGKTKKCAEKKKQKLTKKNKFSTEEDFKEFEEKYEFHVKCLTEEEMVEDMERRRQSEKYLQGEYKCELCFRGFSTKTAYDNHVKDKHDPNIGPNECHLCHARYRFAVNRNQHIQDAHRLQFRCRRCDQLVPGEPHAVEHAAGHAGAMFKCRHCDKQFLKKTTCATHMRLDHPAENAAAASCAICGETFVSRTGLNCHRTRAHNKPYNPKLHCRKCRIQFDNTEALQKHKVNRPGNKCDPHGNVCCACGEWCADADSLVLHAHRQHGTALFTCDECNKSFLSKLSLSTHMDRVHRGVRPARARERERDARCGASAAKVCETCGKTFQCLALLKQHQVRHTGDRPFKCEQCPKSYATAGELRTHRVRHTGQKPHKCDRCAKCYGTAAALKVHVEAVHIRLRQYRCSQCPKTFLRATALSVHKVVHTGEKRFECALCGAKFTQAGSLATHRKYVHLKLKPPPRKRHNADKSSLLLENSKFQD